MMVSADSFLPTTLTLSVLRKVSGAQRTQVFGAIDYIMRRYDAGLGRSLKGSLQTMVSGPTEASYAVQRNALVPFCAAGNSRALMAIEYLNVYPEKEVDRLIELHFVPTTNMRSVSFQQLLMGYFHDHTTPVSDVADLIVNLFNQQVDGLVVTMDELEKYR